MICTALADTYTNSIPLNNPTCGRWPSITLLIEHSAFQRLLKALTNFFLGYHYGIFLLWLSRCVRASPYVAFFPFHSSLNRGLEVQRLFSKRISTSVRCLGLFPCNHCVLRSLDRRFMDHSGNLILPCKFPWAIDNALSVNTNHTLNTLVHIVHCIAIIQSNQPS